MAADTAERLREGLLAVYLAYVVFAQRHPDLLAVMFHSGIDKTPYLEVHASANRASALAGKLATQVEPSPNSAEQLATAIWTIPVAWPL